MKITKNNNIITINYSEIVSLFGLEESIHNRFGELFEKLSVLKGKIPEKDYDELSQDIKNSHKYAIPVFAYYDNIAQEIFETDEFWVKNDHKDIKTWINPGYHVELFTSLRYLHNILYKYKKFNRKSECIELHNTIDLVKKLYVGIVYLIEMVDDSDTTLSSFLNPNRYVLRYSICA